MLETLPVNIWILIEKGGIPLVILYMVWKIEQTFEKLVKIIEEKDKRTRVD